MVEAHTSVPEFMESCSTESVLHRRVTGGHVILSHLVDDFLFYTAYNTPGSDTALFTTVQSAYAQK